MGQKLGGKAHIGTNLMTQALLEYQTSGLKASPLQIFLDKVVENNVSF